eukprot:11929942-Alexandrium_andersonii.AAC.1
MSPSVRWALCQGRPRRTPLPHLCTYAWAREWGLGARRYTVSWGISCWRGGGWPGLGWSWRVQEAP